MTVTHLSLAIVRDAVQSFTFAWSNEYDLQDGIALALDRADISYEREVQLGNAGRVDFLVDDIAVEVKVRGSRAAVLRQLYRYAVVDDVAAVLLVTPSLKLVCPYMLASKPAGLCRIPRLIG